MTDLDVQLTASFGGVTFLPSCVAIGRNSINPKLTFLEEGIEYKVIFKKYKQYSDIQLVDLNIYPGTKNLEFMFKDSVWTFTANVSSQEGLKKALEFLEKKNCVLSQEAKIFLKKET